MSKRDAIISPVVVLGYVHINTPDSYKGVQKYSVTARLDPKIESHKKFKDHILSEAKRLLPKLKKPKLPFKVDEETGEVTFKATSKYQPAVFDAKNQSVPLSKVKIGGGTKARLMLALNPYDEGMSLYVNQVQIIELVEFQGAGGKSAFDEADGFAYDGPAEEPSTEEGAASSDEGEDEGDPLAF